MKSNEQASTCTITFSSNVAGQWFTIWLKLIFRDLQVQILQAIHNKCTNGKAIYLAVSISILPTINFFILKYWCKKMYFFCEITFLKHVSHFKKSNSYAKSLNTQQFLFFMQFSRQIAYLGNFMQKKKKKLSKLEFGFSGPNFHYSATLHSIFNVATNVRITI